MGSGVKYPELADGAEAIGFIKIIEVFRSDPVLSALPLTVAPFKDGYDVSELAMPVPPLSAGPFLRPKLVNSWIQWTDLKHYEITMEMRLFLWVPSRDEVDALNVYNAIRTAILPTDPDRFAAVKAIWTSNHLLLPKFTKSASNLMLVHQEQDAIRLDSTINLLFTTPINTPLNP